MHLIPTKPLLALICLWDKKAVNDRMHSELLRCGHVLAKITSCSHTTSFYVEIWNIVLKLL